MSLKSYQIRLGLFGCVSAIAAVNALAIWGEPTARLGELVLQSLVGVAPILCGLVVARRMTGPSRRWRLLVVAGCLAFLVGELLWWATGTNPTAPPVSVVAYFLPPLFGLAAMVVLVRADHALAGRPDNHLRHSRVTTAIDGIVAAIAFTILVVIAGTGPSLPRSDNTAVVVAYALVELVVVVAGVIMAVVYRADRPYRANYLWLAAGILIGPWGLGLVTNPQDMLHFSEFGVVLMLFLVGLELEPRRLWSLRKPIFGWGSVQLFV